MRYELKRNRRILIHSLLCLHVVYLATLPDRIQPKVVTFWLLLARKTSTRNYFTDGAFCGAEPQLISGN